MASREELKKKRIGVLMGGMSSEREVSLMSGKAILAALLDLGYEALPVEADEQLARRLREEKIEVAFIGLHGALGEDGSVQGLLEMMRIPYTGSGILASALAMNKLVSRQIFTAERFTRPPLYLFARAATEGGSKRLDASFLSPGGRKTMPGGFERGGVHCLRSRATFPGPPRRPSLSAGEF